MRKALLCSMFLLFVGGYMNAQVIRDQARYSPITKGKLLMQTLSERHSTREFSEKELSLHELSDILWCADGINRKESGMRTVPSAMNKQEIDVYAVMKDAAYLYDAKKSELVPVAAGDHRKAAGMQPFVAAAPLNLIYVADLNKMSGDETTKLVYAAVSAGASVQSAYFAALRRGWPRLCALQ